MADILSQKDIDTLLNVCDDVLEKDEIQSLLKILENSKVSGKLNNIIVEVPQDIVNKIIDNLLKLEKLS